MAPDQTLGGAEGGKMVEEKVIEEEKEKVMEEKEKLFCRIFLPLAWSGHIGLGLALGKTLNAHPLENLEYEFNVCRHIRPNTTLPGQKCGGVVLCLFEFVFVIFPMIYLHLVQHPFQVHHSLDPLMLLNSI